MPKNRCSNCVAYNFECTYVEAAKVSVETMKVSAVANLVDEETRPP
jgi:hypothetical protein